MLSSWHCLAVTRQQERHIFFQKLILKELLVKKKGTLCLLWHTFLFMTQDVAGKWFVLGHAECWVFDNKVQVLSLCFQWLLLCPQIGAWLSAIHLVTCKVAICLKWMEVPYWSGGLGSPNGTWNGFQQQESVDRFSILESTPKRLQRPMLGHPRPQPCSSIQRIVSRMIFV